MISLGQRIRELRVKIGITQIELSKDICTPSMISQIESDRARPSYKILFALADRLAVPLENLILDVDLNLENMSKYKMARAMVAGREYELAIPLLQELLELPSNQISHMDTLFELGECYLQIGQYEDAEKVYQKVQEHALRYQDHYVLALVYKNIGVIEYRRNQIPLAAYQWQKAIEETEKMEKGDVYLKADLLYRLGLIQFKLGKIANALEYYNQAADLYGDNLFEIGNVYMEMGVAYSRLKNFVKASEYSDKALSIFAGLDNIMKSLQIQTSRAAVFMNTGHFDEAEQLLLTVIKRYQEYGKRVEEGGARGELAKLRVLQGNLREAEELCQQARSLLPEMHVQQAYIYRILAHVAIKRKQTQEAFRRLQQAADLFKLMNDLKEWDETMFEIAKLHYEENDVSRAFGVLESMRSFTQKAMNERGVAL